MSRILKVVIKDDVGRKSEAPEIEWVEYVSKETTKKSNLGLGERRLFQKIDDAFPNGLTIEPKDKASLSAMENIFQLVTEQSKSSDV